MKTVLVSALICALCSLIPVLMICLGGVTEAASAAGDQATVLFLLGVASTLIWLTIAIWAITRMRYKSPTRLVRRRTKFVMSVIAAGYLVGLFFLFMA